MVVAGFNIPTDQLPDPNHVDASIMRKLCILFILLSLYDLTYGASPEKNLYDSYRVMTQTDPGSTEQFVRECEASVPKSQYVQDVFQTACGAYIEGVAGTLFIINEVAKGDSSKNSFNICVDTNSTRDSMRKEFVAWAKEERNKEIVVKGAAVIAFVLEKYSCDRSH